MGWADGALLGFDTETTGISVYEDRIVSASLVHVTTDGVNDETLYINPGVPIPDGASAIHGITNEWIAANGGDPAEELEAVAAVLAAVLGDRATPIVGHNLVYDFTILDYDCRRNGVVPLSERIDIWPCVDTFVLDKKVDPFRKGTGMRKLENILPLYNIPQDGTAHTSSADALAALRVAWRMSRMYPALGALSCEEVHQLQVRLKVDQDKNMATWLKGQKRDYSDCTGEWPVRLPAVPTGELEDVPLW